MATKGGKLLLSRSKQGKQSKGISIQLSEDHSFWEKQFQEKNKGVDNGEKVGKNVKRYSKLKFYIVYLLNLGQNTTG